MNTSCFTHKLNLTTEKRMPWYKSCWCPTQSQPWRRTAITLLKPSRYFIGLHSYVLYGKKKLVIQREVESTTSLQTLLLSSMRLCWKIAEPGAVFRGFLFTLLNPSAPCLLPKHLYPTNAHTRETQRLFPTCSSGATANKVRASESLEFSTLTSGSKTRRSEDRPPSLSISEAPVTSRTTCRRNTC